MRKKGKEKTSSKLLAAGKQISPKAASQSHKTPLGAVSHSWEVFISPLPTTLREMMAEGAEVM